MGFAKQTGINGEQPFKNQHFKKVYFIFKASPY